MLGIELIFSQRDKKAFTLLEILIVTTIIGLLAAIGIPNLLRSKMSANEAAAQATLKTISTACEIFVLVNLGAYPTAETDLLNAAHGGVRLTHHI